MKTWLEMATVDEESSSVCSPSIPDEEILHCVTYGQSPKRHNVVSIQDNDIGLYTSTSENYNAMIKNNTGYYSGNDSESLAHDNGSYISEKAAFHTAKKTTYASPQHKSHLESAVIEEEGPIQSSQVSVTSPNASGYMTLEGQHLSHTQNAIETTNSFKGQTNYIPNSTTPSSPTEVLVEEANENKLPTNLEGEYFPYTTAEIHTTSDSLTSPTLAGGKYNNKDSPVISEGDYFPYTTAVSQHDCSAVTMLSENSTTEDNHPVSMESSVKQATTAVTDNFPYVTVYEDNSSYPAPHDNDTNECYTTDIPHSSSLFPDTTVQAQHQHVDYSINIDHQHTVNPA